MYKPSLPSPWATTLGSVYSGRRPNSQLDNRGETYHLQVNCKYTTYIVRICGSAVST